MAWWLNDQLRTVQTNLREIDINLDPAAFVEELKAFSANMVLFNVGGIVANYETALDYHFRNPFLKDEILGDVIHRCHQADIRFMARFDFSKINESLAARRPEWLYVSEAGHHNNYNGQVQTCVSGGYQQTYCLKILTEVIERYEIDSVFFNMTGYQRDDYDRNYLGICQCNACRTSFVERTGMELPPTADTANPAFIELERFALARTNEQYDQINSHVKQLNPDIAVCTYTNRGVDIWRKEAATTFERNLEWNYESSMRVKSVLPVFQDKTVTNTAVHFLSRRFRYSAVAPDLSLLRLAENISNAAPLDFFVMGTLGNQMDRSSYAGVKDLFAFYKANARWYQGVKQVADVCLIHPEANYIYGAQDEFYGLLRMLAEQHVLYDIWPEDLLAESDALKALKQYSLVIVGEARTLAPSILSAMDAYVAEGGAVIATGQTASYDRLGRAVGRSLLASSGVTAIRTVEPKSNSSYFLLSEQDKHALNGFSDLDVIFLHGAYMQVETANTAQTLLNHIRPHMHGPPEKCYYTNDDVTDDPGIIINTFGKGTFVTVPWALGTHYQIYGNHAHGVLLARLVSRLVGSRLRLQTTASPLVEFNAQCRSNEDWMLVSLVNHTGQNGHAFHAPEPIHDIEITVEPGFAVSNIHALRGAAQLPFTQGNGRVTVTLPRLDLLETLVFSR